MRILLAEDNLVNQMVAAAMLRKRGHAVTIVSNGREAVEAVRQGDGFDLVLMDIQMPEMDGLVATAQIRSTPAGTSLPILALTAHLRAEEYERCLAQGMNGYLTKPFQPQDLFAAVEQYDPAPAPMAHAAPPPAATDRVAVDVQGFRHAMEEVGAGEAVDRILELFMEHAGPRLETLRVAVQAGDTASIGRAAHAFKSPAASIGAHRLAAMLQEMESASRAGDLATAASHLAAVERETEAVLAELRASGEKGNP